MGILNVTPDSFSDGGLYSTDKKAVSRALKMAEEGAAIIDIGGESTRPGADPVSLEEELQRTIPVIASLRQYDLAISIDTSKAEVARQAIAAGACIINDISALTGDPAMMQAAVETNAGIVMMHKRGTPRDMQRMTHYRQPVTREIKDYLDSRCRDAISAGIARNRIALDPGIGFGKTPEQNIRLLQDTGDFVQMGYPVVIGASRKSFLGHYLSCERTADRLAGSLAVAAWCAMKGAAILRAHDVKETCDLVNILNILSTHDEVDL